AASVGTRPHRLVLRRGAAHQAGLRRLARAELLVGQHADRRLRFLLDARLAVGRAAPAREHESAIALDDLAELRVVGDAAVRVRLAPGKRAIEERTRIVAFVPPFTRASRSAEPHQPANTNPPSPSMISRNFA